MMKSLFSVALIVLVCTVFALAQQQKLTRYDKLKKTAANGPFEYNSEVLKIHATTKHNYSLIVLFSTKDERVKCPLCKLVNMEYKRMFTEFLASLGSQIFESPKFLEHPVFFGNCELTECKDIVIEGGWREFPKLVYIAPAEDKQGFAYRLLEDMEELLDDPTAEAMAEFVSRKTGNKFSVPVPLSVTITWYLGVALLLVAVVGLGQRFLKEYKNPMLWFAVCVGIYGISMAGTVFNAIHKPANMWRHPQTGQTMLIYPSPRMQFVYEGLLMAVLMTASAGAWIAAVRYIPKVKDHWKQRLYFILFMGGFAMMAQVIRGIFRGKYGYYPY